MRDHVTKPNRWLPAVALVLGVGLAAPAGASAGQLAWLDEVVQQVVREAGAGGRPAVRAGVASATTARAPGRLFVHGAAQGLELVARRSEELAGAGGRVQRPAEALVQERFARLMRHDPEALRTFKTLEPAEK